MDDDQEQFTRFVQQSGPRLYRSAVLLCGDPHLAEDLLQTTFTKLFVSWRRVQRAGNPVGYAHTTLTHVFLSHRSVRRNTERPTADVGDVHGNRSIVGRSSGDPADVGVERLDLTAALRTLTFTDRAVVVLRYVEDRSVREVAVELGLTEQAVRNRAARAVARLRPYLTEDRTSLTQEQP